MISAILRRIFRARPDPTHEFRQAIRDSVRGELDETFSVTREQLLKPAPEIEGNTAAAVHIRDGQVTAEIFLSRLSEGWYNLVPRK